MWSLKGTPPKFNSKSPLASSRGLEGEAGRSVFPVPSILLKLREGIYPKQLGFLNNLVVFHPLCILKNQVFHCLSKPLEGLKQRKRLNFAKISQVGLARGRRPLKPPKGIHGLSSQIGSRQKRGSNAEIYACSFSFHWLGQEGETRSTFPKIQEFLSFPKKMHFLWEITFKIIIFSRDMLGTVGNVIIFFWGFCVNGLVFQVLS